MHVWETTNSVDKFFLNSTLEVWNSTSLTLSRKKIKLPLKSNYEVHMFLSNLF